MKMLRWLCGVQSTIWNYRNCSGERKNANHPNVMSIRRKTRSTLIYKSEKVLQCRIKLCQCGERNFIGVVDALRRKCFINIFTFYKLTF